jgi:uncharacterized protein DUF2628
MAGVHIPVGGRPLVRHAPPRPPDGRGPVVREESRPPAAKPKYRGDAVDIISLIVFVLIVFGLLIFFIWLTRTLPAYQPLKVGPPPPVYVERDLSHHVTPPKLGWNWWAFFLGPIWFLAEGLWVHAIILVLLIGLSAGILLPFAMLYSGAKAEETRKDAKLARLSVY